MQTIIHDCPREAGKLPVLIDSLLMTKYANSEWEQSSLHLRKSHLALMPKSPQVGIVQATSDIAMLAGRWPQYL